MRVVSLVVGTACLLLTSALPLMPASSSVMGAPARPTLPTAASSGVNATLVLRNNTLFPGNFAPAAQSWPVGLAFDSINGDLYVTDFQTNNLSVIDPRTDQIVREIPVGRDPAGAAFDPANGYVYVAEGFFNGNVAPHPAVAVVDGATNTVVASFTPGNYPLGLAYDTWTRGVWVATYGGVYGSVDGYNTTTNQIVTSTPAVGNPDGMAFDRRNGELYVAMSTPSGGAVAVFNGTTGRLDATVPTGTRPSGVAYDSSNGDVYVVNEAPDDNVTVINGATNHVIASVSVGSQIPGLPQPFGIAFDPVNGNVYVANEWSGDVSVINGATNVLTGTVTVGEAPSAVAVDASGDVFVADSASNNVTVISGSTDRAVSSILIGTRPAAMLADPLNGDVYVASTDTLNVAVVTETSEHVATWIEIPSVARGFALNPSTGVVYVVGDNGNRNGTLYMLDGATNRIVDSFQIGFSPTAVAFDSIHDQLYVTTNPAYGGPEFWSYNASTKALVATFLTLPSGIAFDPKNGNIYLTNTQYNRVEVYASANNSQVGSVSVRSPYGIVYGPRNEALYVATPTNVSVIDGGANRVVGGIPLTGGPFSLGVDTARGFVYVAGYTSNTVTVVDGSTNQVLESAAVGLSPDAVAVDRATGVAFVANSKSGTIAFLPPVGAPSTPSGPFFGALTAATLVAAAGVAALVLWRWRRVRSRPPSARSSATPLLPGRPRVP